MSEPTSLGFEIILILKELIKAEGLERAVGILDWPANVLRRGESGATLAPEAVRSLTFKLERWKHQQEQAPKGVLH